MWISNYSSHVNFKLFIMCEFHTVHHMWISNCSSRVNFKLFITSEFSGMLSRSHEQSKRFIKVIVDLVALAAQATGFVVWPLLEGREKPELWLIPLTVILISCGWWENYVNIPKDSHSSELRYQVETGLQYKPLFPCHKQRALFTSLIPEGHILCSWRNAVHAGS